MIKKLLTIFVFVSTIVVAQEKVLLRYDFEKGASYDVRMKTTQNIGVGAMATTINVEMQQDIIGVSKAEFETSSKITRIKMDSNQGVAKMSYDSNTKEEDLDATSKMLHAKMGPMINTNIGQKCSTRGKILEIKVPDNMPYARSFAEQTNTVVYPEEAVKVGDNWTTLKKHEGMNLNLVYTVKSITSKSVHVDITGETSGIVAGTVSGTMNIDRISGLPFESNMKIVAKAQGQDITAETEISYSKK